MLNTILPPQYSWVDLSDSHFSNTLNCILNTKDNLNIIGCAGTGKTLLLKLASELLVGNIVVLSSTGISAVNASTEGIKGSTIHSFFKFAPLTIYSSSQLRKKEELKDLVNEVTTFIIDETSMINASLFDFMMETILLYRSTREKKYPRFILFSDILQLSPIIDDTTDIKKYFDTMYNGHILYFNSFSFKDLGFKNIHLNHIYRQKDNSFQNILNRIRQGTQTKEDLSIINERFCEEEQYFKDNEYYIYLSSTNKIADDVNWAYFYTFEGKEYTYRGYTKGNFDFKKFPYLLREIKLKKDMQVICLKNNVNYRNGTMGKVLSCYPNMVEIETKEHDKFLVKRGDWDQYEYTFDSTTKEVLVTHVGSYNMIELKPCMALTIHKSQGLTLDNIFLDITYTTYGLTYVALSRCRTLEGIGLKRKITSSMIKVNPEALEFLNKM